MDKRTDVIVIGGGPSGIMAAISAAIAGAYVVLVEQNEKLGKKLYITGKGRCNLTNIAEGEDFLNNVPRNPRFLYSALYNLGPSQLMDVFESYGVKLKVERGGRVFPESDKSSDITRALERELSRLGVDVWYNAKVTKILTDENGIELDDGTRLLSGAIVIATGGASYPLTGSTGDGYRFASELGHEVYKARPALVPLNTVEQWPASLSGLSLKNVTLTYKEGKKNIFSEQGELLFTHFGISGPLVLTLSSVLPDDPRGVKLTIDMKPALDFETLDNRLVRDIAENSRKQLVTILDGLLPKSMSPIVAHLANMQEALPVNQITAAKRQDLIKILKAIPLTVHSFRDMNEAIITRGGVKVNTINSSTMMSKLHDGIFFAGELIDVDAATGGFNLQIAFSTGSLAGKHAAEHALKNSI